MEPVISPEIIENLCRSSEEKPEQAEIRKEEPAPRRTLWERFKTRAKEIWEVAKPVINVAITVIGAVTGFFNAYNTFRKSTGKKMRRAFA